MNLFAGIFGDIKNPFSTYFGADKYAGGIGEAGKVFGLIVFLNNIIRLLFVLAGLYAFFNLILAGLGFISAGGDPKNISSAWAKIWQSLLGLLIIVGSFVLAAIFGQILFGNAGAILSPQLYGPK